MSVKIIFRLPHHLDWAVCVRTRSVFHTIHTRLHAREKKSTNRKSIEIISESDISLMTHSSSASPVSYRSHLKSHEREKWNMYLTTPLNSASENKFICNRSNEMKRETSPVESAGYSWLREFMECPHFSRLLAYACPKFFFIHIIVIAFFSFFVCIQNRCTTYTQQEVNKKVSEDGRRP